MRMRRDDSGRAVWGRIAPRHFTKQGQGVTKLTKVSFVPRPRFFLRQCAKKAWSTCCDWGRRLAQTDSGDQMLAPSPTSIAYDLAAWAATGCVLDRGTRRAARPKAATDQISG